ERTFDEMIDKYLSEYSISKTENGQIRDKSIAKGLCAFFGSYRLREVTPPLIVDYKAKRRKDGVKPSTIERELCLMKRAFNLAVREWEWVDKNPNHRVSKERYNNTIDRWLSFEEEKRLLRACPDWLQLIVIFALNTGMRQGEILDLRWSYVDLSRRTATVMRSKNGERRTLPLNEQALEVLRAKGKVRHLKNDYVFASQTGTRVIKRNLARAFSQAREKAVVEEFRFHDLRHTFATRLAHAGVDLYTVAKLLGHKDIRMTQRYAHHSVESLRSGVDVLDRSVTIQSQSG
ncbi:MAG: site-specific integrase, partial [Proteobacteria bacterium]|nr:site-specific integrase [Pseudomonadota bacterium]